MFSRIRTRKTPNTDTFHAVDILDAMIFVFFSNRTGWIPSFEDFSANLASQYGWVYGLTVTEMEIVHGAFRKLNPNGIYLFSV